MPGIWGRIVERLLGFFALLHHMSVLMQLPVQHDMIYFFSKYHSTILRIRKAANFVVFSVNL